MIADDNRDTVAPPAALLEEGHTVRAFNSGTGVINAVREFQPDACVLDIDMPGASGYAIARELFEHSAR